MGIVDSVQWEACTAGAGGSTASRIGMVSHVRAGYTADHVCAPLTTPCPGGSRTTRPCPLPVLQGDVINHPCVDCG